MIEGENLKIFLRGRATGVDFDTIRHTLVPVEYCWSKFTLADWEAALLSPSDEELLKSLNGSPFVKTLKRIHDKYKNDSPDSTETRLKRLPEEMDAIDYEVHAMRRFLIRGKKTSTQKLNHVLALEIDQINMRTFLILKRNNLPPEAIELRLLPGGCYFSREFLSKRVGAPSLAEAIRSIRGENKQPELDAVLGKAQETGDCIPIDRLMRKQFMNALRAAAVSFPLSPLTVIEYLRRRRREVAAIQLIARGKRQGLPESEILDLLLL